MGLWLHGSGLSGLEVKFFRVFAPFWGIWYGRCVWEFQGPGFCGFGLGILLSGPGRQVPTLRLRLGPKKHLRKSRT